MFASVMGVQSDAIGADGISLKFVKLILPELFPILTHALDHVIVTSSFLSQWKTALVVPIPKTSDPPLISDFRTISKQPVLSKVTENFFLIRSFRCYNPVFVNHTVSPQR